MGALAYLLSLLLKDLFSNNNNITRGFLIEEVKAFKLEHVDTVVDIGCQNGLYSRVVAHVYPNIFFKLEDLEQFSLKKVNTTKYINYKTSEELKKTLINSDYAPNIKNRYQFIAGKEDSIPLQTSSCKRILCRKTLHEFKEKQKMVNEMIRVLAPNGILTIAEPEPIVLNQIDANCNNKYLTKEDVLALFTGLKNVDIKTIKYPKGNMILYDFSK